MVAMTAYVDEFGVETYLPRVLEKAEYICQRKVERNSSCRSYGQFASFRDSGSNRELTVKKK